MKNNGLLLSAILATVLFAGNALGVNLSTGPFKVDNQTGADVWLHARVVGVPGKSDYLHVSPKEKYTLKDLAVRKIKFRSYICKGGVPTQIENDYTIKTGDAYWLTLTIQGDKIVVTEKEKGGMFDF